MCILFLGTFQVTHYPHKKTSSSSHTHAHTRTHTHTHTYTHTHREREREDMGIFSLFSSSRTKRDQEKINAQCGTRKSALSACVLGNTKEACEKLAEDLALCKARVVERCQSKAETFEEMCVRLVVVREQSNEEKRKCAKAVKQMQKCVKRFH